MQVILVIYIFVLVFIEPHGNVFGDESDDYFSQQESIRNDTQSTLPVASPLLIEVFINNSSQIKFKLNCHNHE